MQYACDAAVPAIIITRIRPRYQKVQLRIVNIILLHQITGAVCEQNTLVELFINALDGIVTRGTTILIIFVIIFGRDTARITYFRFSRALPVYRIQRVDQPFILQRFVVFRLQLIVIVSVITVVVTICKIVISLGHTLLVFILDRGQTFS